MNAMTIHQWADKLDEMASDGIGAELYPDAVVELAAVLREHLAARSHEALFLGHINGAPVGLHGTKESVQALESYLIDPLRNAISDEEICLRRLRDGKWIARKGSAAIPELFDTAQDALAAMGGILNDRSAQRLHVGDSSFESWYADKFNAAGKGAKQQAREAYEAGMNDPAGMAQPVGVATIDAKYDDVLLPFARLMARELHANAGKGDRPGWLRMSATEGVLEIYYHTAKLQKAVKDGEGDRISEYAADVANMAMMLLDVCGGLDVSAAIGDSHE